MSRAVTSTASGELTRPLLDLKLRAIWQSLLASPWSFRWTCLYVFFEYVRPQQIYTFIQGPPWALALIILALVSFVAEGAQIKSRTPINYVLLVFTGVVLASSVMAAFPDESWKQLPVYANWVIAFLLIANTATTERRWFLFIVLYLLWNLKMSQHGFLSWASRGFSFAGWGVNGSPGWFQNSGEFALQMCMFIPLSIYFIVAVKPFVSTRVRYALWALPITGVASVIASSSRGGQLALVLVALVAVARSAKRARNLGIIAVLAPLLWLIMPAQQKARFQSSGDDATSQLRLIYWKRGIEMAKEHPVLGVGHGNWVPYYKAHYYSPSDTLNRFDERGELKIEVAHNSFVEVMSQLGYSGLVVFIGLLLSIFLVNAQSRKSLKQIGSRGRFLDLMSRGLDDGVIGFAAAGYFMSVAFYPFVWFQLAMAAGLHAAALQLVRSKQAESSILKKAGSLQSIRLRPLNGGGHLRDPAPARQVRHVGSSSNLRPRPRES